MHCCIGHSSFENLLASIWVLNVTYHRSTIRFANTCCSVSQTPSRNYQNLKLCRKARLYSTHCNTLSNIWDGYLQNCTSKNIGIYPNWKRFGIVHVQYLLSLLHCMFMDDWSYNMCIIEYGCDIGVKTWCSTFYFHVTC